MGFRIFSSVPSMTSVLLTPVLKPIGIGVFWIPMNPNTPSMIGAYNKVSKLFIQVAIIWAQMLMQPGLSTCINYMF
jgi:hypothetical protein